MVALQRFQFPLVAEGVAGRRLLEGVVSVLVWHGTMASGSSANLTERRERQMKARMPHDKQKRAIHAAVLVTVWHSWLMVCVLASAPSALYSSAKAVPGFLGLSSEAQWFVSASVSVLTATLTAFVLPKAVQPLLAFFNADDADESAL
eukprot:5075875-Amphidinium_carterae.1